MFDRYKRIAVSSLVVFALVFISVSPTMASHNHGRPWASGFQSNGYDYWIVYRAYGFSSSFRSRLGDGRSTWNGVGRELFFHNSQTTSTPAIDVSYMDMFWTSNLAEVLVCIPALCSTINAATMRFDNETSWYTGTGTPGASQFDAFGVAAHEFGHAVEMNHSLATADTMFAYASTGSAGVSWRSLTAHDKAGIEFLYADH